jgi:hypothetical protein
MIVKIDASELFFTIPANIAADYPRKKILVLRIAASKISKNISHLKNDNKGVYKNMYSQILMCQLALYLFT